MADYIPIRLLKPTYRIEDRSTQREQVKKEFTNLESELIKYLDIWKQVGGGTTGYKIDDIIKRVKKAGNMFRQTC